MTHESDKKVTPQSKCVAGTCGKYTLAHIAYSDGAHLWGASASDGARNQMQKGRGVTLKNCCVL